ncbi:MAG: hypothetical protein ACK53Y_23695, partial [bacterium]
LTHFIVIFPSKLCSGFGGNTTPMNIVFIASDLETTHLTQTLFSHSSSKSALIITLFACAHPSIVVWKQPVSLSLYSF